MAWRSAFPWAKRMPAASVTSAKAGFGGSFSSPAADPARTASAAGRARRRRGGRRIGGAQSNGFCATRLITSDMRMPLPGPAVAAWLIIASR